MTTATKAKIKLVVDGVTVYTKQTSKPYVQAMIHRNPQGVWAILASSANPSTSWETLASSAVCNSSVGSKSSTSRDAQDSKFLLCRIVDSTIAISSAQFESESYRIAIVLGVRKATYARMADYTYTATKVESEFVYQNIQLANKELRQKFNRQITSTRQRIDSAFFFGC